MPELMLLYLAAASGALKFDCSDVRISVDGGHWSTTQQILVAVRNEKRKCAKRRASGSIIDLTILEDPNPGPETNVIEVKFELHIGGPNGKKIGAFSQFCQRKNLAACARRTLRIANSYR